MSNNGRLLPTQLARQAGRTFDKPPHLFYITPMQTLIIQTILAHYPATQAVYLFGSYGTENEWPQSDVDIALLLPPAAAKQTSYVALTNLQLALEQELNTAVDLINLRQATTVFQKEIIMAERRIFTADQYAADEFEMLTLSFYLKLNEERSGILTDGLQSGRFYKV